MKLSAFEYTLPKEFIAQEPTQRRDESRLIVLNRAAQKIEEYIFKDIVKIVNPGDLFVLNNTRVLPARLFGKRATGGRIELLLLQELSQGVWEALIKPGRKVRLGDTIIFAEGVFTAEVLEKIPSGGRVIRFSPQDIRGYIKEYGQMPLPHYIKKTLKKPARYQTVYAKKTGAIAAPTAGLHFTKRVISQLIARGIEIVYVTLHCGLATFRPVKTEDIRDHIMGQERYEIDVETAKKINKAKLQGRRIIAVGTTVVRALESAAVSDVKGEYQVVAKQNSTQLYIYPGYKFKIVDALLTNFHLPASTNLILVSAFGGIEFIKNAYQYAIKKNFRFYSLGDTMLIV